jgi:hypothetical protein
VIAAPRGVTYIAVAKLLQQRGIVVAAMLQSLFMIWHRD